MEVTIKYYRTKKMGCIFRSRILTKYNYIGKGKYWKMYRTSSNYSYIGGSNNSIHVYNIKRISNGTSSF